jgi:hypothetical protein
MANDPPFATLNHVAGDLGIPSESALLRFGIIPLLSGPEGLDVRLDAVEQMEMIVFSIQLLPQEVAAVAMLRAHPMALQEALVAERREVMRVRRGDQEPVDREMMEEVMCLLLMPLQEAAAHLRQEIAVLVIRRVPPEDLVRQVQSQAHQLLMLAVVAAALEVLRMIPMALAAQAVVVMAVEVQRHRQPERTVLAAGEEEAAVQMRTRPEQKVAMALSSSAILPH